MLKAKLEVAKMAAGAGAGVKRKRAGGADVVPYSRESAKKGRKGLEEKREVFLGGLVIEQVDLAEGDVGGEFAGDFVASYDGSHADEFPRAESHAQTLPDRLVLQARLACGTNELDAALVFGC